MIAVTGREMANLTEDTSDFNFHSQTLAKDAHSGEAEVRPPAERGLLAAGRAQRRRRTEGVESSAVGRGGGALQVAAAGEAEGGQEQEGQEGRRQDGGRDRGREEGQGREGRGRLPGELKHPTLLFWNMALINRQQ